MDLTMQFQRSLAALLVAGLCTNALAGISQSTLASPGGFFQAGAAPSTSGASFGPGLDLATLIGGAGSMLNEGSFSGLGFVARSASSTGANQNNSSSGSAGMGYVLFDASNDAPNSSFFPVAGANGGWKDTFTVLHPAHNGQAGFLQFTVDASGFLEAVGFAGSVSMQVTAFKDNIQLLANQFSSPGNSNPLSTDRQYGNWGFATNGSPSELSESINGTATFAVPIIFGTPFTLGVYGSGLTGMRSSSGVAGNSTSRIESGRFRWGGILNIFAGSTSVTAGATVVSASGKDWGPGVQPPDPCPGDLNLDGFVDDADFVVFVNSYNILDCADPSMPEDCPGDMNSDGVVDDSDFVEFVAAYNELVCI